jgi:spore germination protein KC
MKRRHFVLVLCLCCLCCLTGCWDYRGMDEINIVSGAALDRNAEGDGYELTLEIVDVASIKEDKKAQSRLVTAEGVTLFEANRNTKKKLFNRLYYGSMQVLVISADVAREDGILPVLDVFLRDVEPRENLLVLVSMEPTSKALLNSTGLDVNNVSFELAAIVREDEEVDSTSTEVMAYEAYNMIHAPGRALILPAFRLVENDGKQVAEIHGIALFDGDKLAGFLPPEDTRTFLMIAQKGGGLLSFPVGGDPDHAIALEIDECRSQADIRYDAARDRVIIAASVSMELLVADLGRANISTDADGLRRLEEDVGSYVRGEIAALFAKVQTQTGLDIFGYGQQVYEDQYALWKQIGQDWPRLFRNAAFEVEVSVQILGTGIR